MKLKKPTSKYLKYWDKSVNIDGFSKNILNSILQVKKFSFMIFMLSLLKLWNFGPRIRSSVNKVQLFDLIVNIYLFSFFLLSILLDFKKWEMFGPTIRSSGVRDGRGLSFFVCLFVLIFFNREHHFIFPMCLAA